MEVPATYNKVYYVETKSERAFNPLAIRPSIIDLTRSEWENTSARGTSIKIKKLRMNGVEVKRTSDLPSQEPKTIEMVSTEGEKITLRLLTVQLFKKCVQERVAGGAGLEFKKDEDLQNYFLDTDFNSFL